MNVVTMADGASSVEPVLRLLTASQLGVDPEELAPEVSLMDDLAADSLDLAELAVVLEEELGVALPPYDLDEVRTYGDLAALVTAAVARCSPPAAAIPYGETARSSVVYPAGSTRVERVDVLTPYAIEIIADDAVHAGRGARLEVAMPPGTDVRGLAAVRQRLAGLRRRGVEVSVRPAPLSRQRSLG
jgi:acyl carrier protein